MTWYWYCALIGEEGESEGIYTKVGNTTLSGYSMNQDDDIYKYLLDSPLEFQSGDIFQPQH